MMIETWKWVHDAIFGQSQASVTMLSIATESQPKLQGTQNGWFQWRLSDNWVTRIEYVETIESLLERHKNAPTGIEHVVVLESGNSELLQPLIQKGQENIKVIFRNRFSAEVVQLLCQPDADILAAWKKVCQGNKPAHKLIQDRALATAYGQSVNQWLSNLHKDDLKYYLPTGFFLPSEFAYVGIEERTLVFALKTFPGAWITLSKQPGTPPSIDAKYAGAFIKAPRLKLNWWGFQHDWNTLDDSFWAKWLKKFNISKKEMKMNDDKSYLLDESDLSNKFDLLKIWAPVFAGITVVAVALWLVFQIQLHPKLIPEIEPGYQVALQKEMIPNREQAFLTDNLGFSETGLPAVSFTEGYKGGIARLSKNDYKSYSEAEKELALYWRLGEWVALLDAGCSHTDNLDSAFLQRLQTIAKSLIDAFKAEDNPPKTKTVVGILDNMDQAITEKLSGNKTNTVLCYDLEDLSVQMAVELR